MKIFLTNLLTGLLMLSIAGIGHAETILDDYVGATPTHVNWIGRDVVGDANYFGITKMEVYVGSGNLTVDIYTNYVSNIGKFGTALGDLFISTNGWNPYGNSPYYDDNSLTGEKWEYALVMDKHLWAGQAYSSGSTSLYSVRDDQIIKSSASSGYIYRANQEVQYNTSGVNAIATGTWSIDYSEKFLRYVITDDILKGLNTIGLHWAMTCGNDVIEGGFAYQNPEPATMILFGFGLLGIAGLGRRKLA